MIQIWTDGSCYWKDRIGGWAYAIVKDDELIYEDYDFELDTTSGRMELTAVLKAVKYMDVRLRDVDFEIISDYKLVVDCFDKLYYQTWTEFDYLGIQNSDIWKKLIPRILNNVNSVKLKHVKGHSGIKWNEHVDETAGNCRMLGKEYVEKNDRGYHRRIAKKISQY